MLYAYFAVVALLIVFPLVMVDRRTVRDRFKRQGGGEDAGRLIVLRLAILAHLVVGLSDATWLRMSNTIPLPLRAFGLALLLAAGWLTYFAMAHNRFFMPVIRIQNDRGHQVESGGPYAVVRHPGYAGMVWLAPASALALGSWASLVIALVPALLFVARTAHEDEFLKKNLAGYEEYAAKVRYRLLPGLW